MKYLEGISKLSIKLKFFLFKLFLKGAIRFAPNEDVAESFRQRVTCEERLKEMQNCVRLRKDFPYRDGHMEQ